MLRLTASVLLAAAPLTFFASPSSAQSPTVTELNAGQRDAMRAFARLDGVWRGPAWSITPQGRHEIIQTERIGPFLGGTVRVIEGRGYNSDGSVGFNALGVISYDNQAARYTLSSWAMGRHGVFPFTPTADGYTWETPAGPGAIIRYTATVRGGVLREVGYRVAGNAPPVQIFEMNLRRVGDTSWPGGDAVPRR